MATNRHDPTAPKQMFKRYMGSWHQRLAVGVNLDHKFKSADASLVLCKGYGKWLEHQWSGTRKTEIPIPLGDVCRRLRSNTQVDFAEFSKARADLSDVLASAIKNVVALSGKATDRLLTAGITDVGIWINDFDGQTCFETFCAADRVAEETGLTIVDSFPSRDIAAGGKGWPVDLLALWLLFADRNPKVATRDRVVFRFGPASELVFLPASDGLDNELPSISYMTFPGQTWFESICEKAGIEPVAVKNVDLSTIDESLLKKWLKSDQDSVQQSIDGSNGQRTVATALRYVACKINEKAAEWCAKDENSDHATELYLFASETWLPLLAKVLSNNDRLAVNCDARNGLDNDSLSSTLAATLSLMTLDQMPATLPWLNGSDSPRTLGKITPGSPNNWRNVILNMADFRPPAMKLRDAI